MSVCLPGVAQHGGNGLSARAFDIFAELDDQNFEFFHAVIGQIQGFAIDEAGRKQSIFNPVQKRHGYKSVLFDDLFNIFYVFFYFLNEILVNFLQGFGRFLPVFNFADKPQSQQQGKARQRIIIRRKNLKTADDYQKSVIFIMFCETTAGDRPETFV